MQDIYSQGQLTRQRRGASVLKSSSKSKYNDSLSKLKKEMKDTSLNFYEGLKSNQRPKPKEETSATMGFVNDEEVEIEELHYQMVKMNQNVRRLQMDI